MKTSRWQPLALFLKATELDTRMLGLVGALLLIWIAFHVLSGGLFLTPRNLWNLSVQSSSVAIMATGMVLVIVTRNIDLSIGSMLGFIGMVMGVIQTLLLPQLLGFEHPATWVLALAAGLLLGIILGAFQGFVIAYLGIPSFIVTLGGLLVWRGGGLVGDPRTDGRTARPHIQADGRRHRGLDRRGVELGRRRHRLRRGRDDAGAGPRPAHQVSLPAPANSGRDFSRRRRLHADPRGRRNFQRLSLARPAACGATRKRTISRFPRAAFSSPTASPFRSSLRSASGWQ